MKFALVLIAAFVFISCNKKQDQAPLVDPKPTPIVVEPSPSVKPKGHIVIGPDFSPACPAIPGFIAPKAGDECEIPFHACSAGAVYDCK